VSPRSEGSVHECAEGKDQEQSAHGGDKKAAAPPAAAFVQMNTEWEFPADPTFKDKNGCTHTYVSPRSEGSVHECAEGKDQEQSAHGGDKKAAAPPAAAFVQVNTEWDFPDDPTFRDKNGCTHTYNA